MVKAHIIEAYLVARISVHLAENEIPTLAKHSKHLEERAIDIRHMMKRIRHTDRIKKFILEGHIHGVGKYEFDIGEILGNNLSGKLSGIERGYGLDIREFKNSVQKFPRAGCDIENLSGADIFKCLFE